MSNLSFLFANQAIAEFLAPNDLLQMTLAELVGRGASRQSIIDLVCALVAAPDDRETTDAEFERVCKCLEAVKAEVGDTGPGMSGGVQ